MKEQQMNAAADALDCSLDRLSEKYMLTPLELLSVVARSLDKRLKAEALDERMAVTTMQNIMDADDVQIEPVSGWEINGTVYPGPETETTMEAIRRGAAEFSAVANPMCYRKHNMMGKATGNCAGGPVVTNTMGRAVLAEVAKATGPNYPLPGGTDGGAY